MDKDILKPAKFLKPTTIEDVLGCTGYKVPRKSLKDMEDAVASIAKEQKKPVVGQIR